MTPEEEERYLREREAAQYRAIEESMYRRMGRSAREVEMHTGRRPMNWDKPAVANNRYPAATWWRRK
jgi:hypothetical protein